MIVLDASATVEWLLGRAAGEDVAARFTDPGIAVHAPAYLGVEVLSALRGLVRGRHVDPDRASAAISHLMASDIELHDPTPLLPRVWTMRDNLTAYDATYVALAETLDATLVTMDARLARAPGLRVRLDVVS